MKAVGYPQKIRPFSHGDMGIKAEDIRYLNQLAMRYKDKAWDTSVKSPLVDYQKAIVTTFSGKLKNYLYVVAQRRYCAYCGDPLKANKNTYQLEHVIPKNDKSFLVFDIRNLALSCVPCNSFKGAVKVTIVPLAETLDAELMIPQYAQSQYYRIRHPYHDDWSDHFIRDEFNRVLPKKGAEFSKGNQTISACGIHIRNAIELSDVFDYFNNSISTFEKWKTFYLAHMTNEKRGRIYREVLQSIMALDPAADELRKVLRLV